MKRSKRSKLLIDGEMFRATVFKVEGRDELGRPRECRMLGEQESVSIKDGDEFIVAFVSERVLGRPN